MKETIDFVLPYFEKGELKYKFIKIKFVSIWITDEFNRLIDDIYSVQAAFDKITDIQDWIDRKETPKDVIEKLKKEKRILENKILEYGKNNYLEDRFDIIKQLLIDNGCEGDEQLMSYEWWYKHVDRKEIKRLLEECAFKDIPKQEKKKKMKIKKK